jgi:hypothetical protein
METTMSKNKDTEKTRELTEDDAGGDTSVRRNDLHWDGWSLLVLT